MEASKYMQRRRLADEDMVANLESRCKRTDRANVEEEELDEHPLLAGTSVMHYMRMPHGTDDFPEFNEKFGAASKLLGEASARLEPGHSPFYFDAHKYLISACAFEYIWAGRAAFIELMIAHANQDTIGYWYKESLSLAQEMLLSLCVVTTGGVMLCDEPGLNHTVIFKYAELDNAGSRLSGVFQMIENQYVVPTFFLHKFEPHQLEKIRKRFPTAHIIGVTCPSIDVESKCLALLKKRLAPKVSSNQIPSQDELAERHRNRYGADSLGTDSSRALAVKPTAKASPKRQAEPETEKKK